MAGKVPKTSNKKPVTLETIKEQLDRQDKEIKQSAVRTLQAVGGAVIIAGLSFVVTSIFPDLARACYGVFLIVFGALFVILVGCLWTERIAKK
jgi:hypothetical protein